MRFFRFLPLAVLFSLFVSAAFGDVHETNTTPGTILKVTVSYVYAISNDWGSSVSEPEYIPYSLAYGDSVDLVDQTGAGDPSIGEYWANTYMVVNTEWITLPPEEEWSPLDEPFGWEYGGWVTPNLADVWEDDAVQIYRPKWQWHLLGEVSNLGATRNTYWWREDDVDWDSTYGTRALNWRRFDQITQNWSAVSDWSPDPATQWEDRLLDQVRALRRVHRTGWTNDRSDESDIGGYNEDGSESRTVWGTRLLNWRFSENRLVRDWYDSGNWSPDLGGYYPWEDVLQSLQRLQDWAEWQTNDRGESRLWRIFVVATIVTRSLKGTQGPGVVVRKVEFLNSYSRLSDYTATFGGTGGSHFNPQGWESGGQNNPVANLKGTRLFMRVTVRVPGPPVSFTLRGYSQNLGGMDFQSDQAYLSSGSATDVVVTVTAVQPLPSAIAILNGSIGWSMGVGGDFHELNPSGAHKVYVTWGALAADPYATVKRVEKACSTANGAGSRQAIADAVHGMVASSTQFDGDGTARGWALLDAGTKGDCDNLAYCMSDVLYSIGVDSQLDGVRASTVGGAGNCRGMARQSRVQNGQTHYLELVYFRDGVPEYNKYEGCCLVDGDYYAISPKFKAANDYDMLLALKVYGFKQYWVRENGSGRVVEMLEEVPFP